MNVERKQIMSKVVLDSSALLALINNEIANISNLQSLRNVSGSDLEKLGRGRSKH